MLKSIKGLISILGLIMVIIYNKLKLYYTWRQMGTFPTLFEWLKFSEKDYIESYDHFKSPEEAIVCYDKGIFFHKNNYLIYLNRAIAKHDLGLMNSSSIGFKIPKYTDMLFKDAIKDYSKAIELNSICREAYHYRGDIELKIELYNEAILDYSKAIEIEPEGTKVYHQRGVAYNKLKEYEKAIEDYSKVIELVPEDKYAYCYRGKILFDIKEYEKAIEDYSKAIELAPEEYALQRTEKAEIYYFRGNTYYQLKEYKNTLNDYNKACEFGLIDDEMINDIQGKKAKINEIYTNKNSIKDNKENTTSKNDCLKNNDIKVNLIECTLEDIMTIEGFDENRANQFINERETGQMWYNAEQFSSHFNLQPHQMNSVTNKVIFPVKSNFHRGRKVDW